MSVEKLSKPVKCSICGGPIEVERLSGWAGGHNAQPVNQGRCCTDCNTMVVLPARIDEIQVREISRRQKETKK